MGAESEETTPGQIVAPSMDTESTAWIRDLSEAGVAHEAALERLHELLLRVARAEMSRRAPRSRITGPELDDLASQAAADAVLAIDRKRGQFRGESRFTTWAYAFVIRELSSKIGRHYSRRGEVLLSGEHWDRLPSHLGFDPAAQYEWRHLVAGLRQAVDERLTERQRRIFVAIVLNGIPLDGLAAELGSNRNAIYKSLFDARRKLRAALVEKGLLEAREERPR